MNWDEKFNQNMWGFRENRIEKKKYENKSDMICFKHELVERLFEVVKR